MELTTTKEYMQTMSQKEKGNPFAPPNGGTAAGKVAP
jgi:hypothetical protein